MEQGSVANYGSWEYRLEIHLRAVLPEGSHHAPAVRMVTEERLRGREPDCQVEEGGL